DLPAVPRGPGQELRGDQVAVRPQRQGLHAGDPPGEGRLEGGGLRPLHQVRGPAAAGGEEEVRHLGRLVPGRDLEVRLEPLRLTSRDPSRAALPSDGRAALLMRPARAGLLMRTSPYRPSHTGPVALPFLT